MNGYIGNQMEFKSRSNRRKVVASSGRKRWCVKHPISFWGEGFNQCVKGYKNSEVCIEGK